MFYYNKTRSRMMLAIVSLCWKFVVTTAGALKSATSSIQVSKADARSLSSHSAKPTCNNDCTGSADMYVFVTGTRVVVDPASTTGPPDCNTQATTLGPGYTFKQTTSILHEGIAFSYDFECGVYTTDISTTYVTFTPITTHLAQFNGLTIACLSSADSIINGYYSVGAYESRDVDLVTRRYVALANPITLQKDDPTTTLNNQGTDHIFSQLATTTCNQELIESSRTGCWSESSAEMYLNGVWMGVPLTYDVSKVSTQPNCVKPLEYLGPGYTGSSTYTTMTYFAGTIDLGTGSNIFLDITPPQASDPQIISDIMISDWQTVGCWTSLYYLAQSYTIITEYHSCGTSFYDSYNDSFTSQVVRLQDPVTDAGQMPFVTTVNGQVSLISKLKNQMVTTPNPTLLVTPTIGFANATSPSLSPSSTLISLGDPDTGLSKATKIILIIVVVFAVALVFSFFAFFLWRRCSVRRSKKHKTARGSSTAKGPSHLIQTKSWRAPLVMLAGFISGLAFALGHHFFYSWVNRQQVDDVNISQSWILRLGNLLAFAVKLSLSISTSVAFVQLQWTKLRQRSMRMKDVDTFSGILANVLSFGDSLVWFQYPVLLSIAIVYWLLPIVPVVTPGTIIVIPQAYEDLTHLQVPQLDVKSSTWFGSDNQGSILLSKIAISSAMLGNILPIQFNYTNATYHLDFLGPALQCSAADAQLTANLSQFFDATLIQQEVDKSTYYTYSAWVGGEDIYDYHSSHCGTNINNLDTTSTDRARLYIMTNDGGESGANVTECSLYNATYHVDFSFKASQQNVLIQSVEYLHGVPFSEVLEGVPLSSYSDDSYGDQVNAYAGLMSVFGSMLVGSIKYDGNEVLRNCTSITYINTGLDFTSGFIHDNAKSLGIFQNSIEEVFRNATVSLMNNHAFLKNLTTADFIPVSITTTLNIYQYNSFDLILTYAIGILITLICCIIGFHTFIINEGSYQNIFSTFIRATKHAELIIEDEDTGADPCPRTLSQALIKLTSNATFGSSQVPQNLVEKQHLIPRKPVAVHREVSDN